MKTATNKDFIGILAEDKPPLIFFRYKEDKESDKIAKTLQEIEKDYPLLNIYEFLIDNSEDNLILAENLGIEKTPILVFYKNSCFNRYKDKLFTKKALTTFIGNVKTYSLKKQEETPL